MKMRKIFFIIVSIISLAISACAEKSLDGIISASRLSETSGWHEYLPKYMDKVSIAVNNNIPFFTEEEITTEVFENYSELDELGRCGVAFANICQEIMPTEERGQIGSIRPSGWHTVKYDVIADKYLYNRCHLIGFQLAGENANEKNLITGTRYLNIEGMLPWENMVAEYVKETGNHVLYRVTPDFEGDNLVASGVRIEAYSVEDKGAGICFHVYCYNVQPGITIHYADGESSLEESGNAEMQTLLSEETWTDFKPGETAKDEEAWDETKTEQVAEERDYVLNTNTKRFHKPDCESVNDMKDKNRKDYKGNREDLMEDGYVPCGRCKP